MSGSGQERIFSVEKEGWNIEVTSHRTKRDRRLLAIVSGSREVKMRT